MKIWKIRVEVEKEIKREKKKCIKQNGWEIK